MGTPVSDPQLRAFQQLSDPADADNSCRFGDDGHANTSNWLCAVTGSSLTDAKRRVRTARMLTDLPAVADAYAEGHIGDDQVEQFRILHVNARVRPYLKDAAGLLIEHGALLPYPDFVTVCRRFAAWADPDGTNRDHDACREHRAMTQTRHGVGFRINVRGDALTGAMIEQALEPFLQAEFAADWAEGRARYGESMCRALLPRTPTQRRYDAFAKMCAAAGDGTGMPTVNINVDDHTVHDVLRAHLDDPNQPMPDWSGRHCETPERAPVSTNDLVIALLFGNVRKVTRDAHGRVVHLGRRRRLFTGAAREAVFANGDRCSFVGCNVRSGRLHIDHTIAWARARGPTDPDNANIECGAHNLAKERLGHSVEPHPTMPRAWVTKRHDGSIIAPRTSPRSEVTGPVLVRGVLVRVAPRRATSGSG